MRLAKFDGKLQIILAQCIVHGLGEKMVKLPVGHHLKIQARLGYDDLEFIAIILNHCIAGLGADANPVYAWGCGQGSVGFNGDLKIVLVEGQNEGFVELQQWLATCHDNIAVRLALRPKCGDVLRQCLGRLKLSAAAAIGSYKVGVAKIALCGGSVGLASGPEVATGEAAKHCGSAGLGALALQGIKRFFDCVHGV